MIAEAEFSNLSGLINKTMDFSFGFIIVGKKYNLLGILFFFFNVIVGHYSGQVGGLRD